MESPRLCKKLLGMFVVSVTGLGNALWMELGEQSPVFCLLLSILNISPLFFLSLMFCLTHAYKYLNTYNKLIHLRNGGSMPTGGCHVHD